MAQSILYIFVYKSTACYKSSPTFCYVNQYKIRTPCISRVPKSKYRHAHVNCSNWRLTWGQVTQLASNVGQVTQLASTWGELTQLALNVERVEANEAKRKGTRLQLASDAERADTCSTLGVICFNSPYVGSQMVSDLGWADTVVPNMKDYRHSITRFNMSPVYKSTPEKLVPKSV